MTNKETKLRTTIWILIFILASLIWVGIVMSIVYLLGVGLGAIFGFTMTFPITILGAAIVNLVISFILLFIS